MYLFSKVRQPCFSHAQISVFILLILLSLIHGSSSISCDRPYCDPAQPSEVRILNLLSLATLQEKVGLLIGRSIDRLNVPKLTTGEALHGVASGCGSDKGRRYCPTSFPSALGLGASRNATLWHRIGQQISSESRALVPAGGARWTPDINLFRDPRYGTLAPQTRHPCPHLDLMPKVGQGSGSPWGRPVPHCPVRCGLRQGPPGG